MPRRKAPIAAPLPVGEVPPEIAVGAVVGIWGEDLLDAHRGYIAGRRRWQAEAELDQATACALAPAPRCPVDGEAAAVRLARHGLDLEDVPALRRAARPRLIN